MQCGCIVCAHLVIVCTAPTIFLCCFFCLVARNMSLFDGQPSILPPEMRTFSVHVKDASEFPIVKGPWTVELKTLRSVHEEQGKIKPGDLFTADNLYKRFMERCKVPPKKKWKLARRRLNVQLALLQDSPGYNENEKYSYEFYVVFYGKDFLKTSQEYFEGLRNINMQKIVVPAPADRVQLPKELEVKLQALLEDRYRSQLLEEAIFDINAKLDAFGVNTSFAFDHPLMPDSSDDDGDIDDI